MAKPRRSNSVSSPSEAKHPNPERVQDPLFRRHPSFFDARDLVQVKYEMLRSHHVDGVPVAEAARRFGLSRQTFYLSDAAFRAARMVGLLPGRPGPKGPRKITPEMAAFLRGRRRADPELGYRELAAALAARFGVQVHPRTVRRLLEKKKLPSDGAAQDDRRGGLPPAGGSPAGSV